MKKILLVEGDRPVREWCTLHLTTQGHDVAALADPRQALEFIRTRLPDLIVIAADSRSTGAFALAASVRSHGRTAGTPILFLVSSQDAVAMAQASEIESAAVVSKPPVRAVFIDAVQRGLALAEAGETAKQSSPGAARQPFTSAPTSLAMETKEATVLTVVLRNLVSLARSLRSTSLDVLLQRFVAEARDMVLGQGGWVVRVDATGLLALFEPSPNAKRPHATRALEAALATLLSARKIKRWAETELPDVPAPTLSVGCGVHTGDVIVARLAIGGPMSSCIAGQTVDVANRLNGRAKGLAWGIAVTETAALKTESRFQFGRRATLTDTDHGVTVPILEVLGYNPGVATPDELVMMAEVREAVLANAMLARLAGDVDPETADRTIVFTGGRAIGRDGLPELPNRRVERRIGQGKFVTTYATRNTGSGQEEIAKTLSLGETPVDFVERYLDEYRILSTVEQRNVVNILEVGSTAAHAFVAVEWLKGEPLSDVIRKRVSIGTALTLLAQMALALDALHDLGLFHGGLRAEHYRFRDERVLVLTDFNVTSRVLSLLARDGDDNAPGLDFARGVRTDFRALGLILLALLSTDSATVESALAARMPDRPEALRLPVQLSQIQPCLDGLVGVAGRKPFERAEEVLVEVLALKDIWSRPVFTET